MSPTTAYDKLLNLQEWPGDWQGKDHFLDLDSDPPNSLRECAIRALLETSLTKKIATTRFAAERWFNRSLGAGSSAIGEFPNRPGRPDRPHLVAAKKLKKRSIRSERGRFALLHAIAHIELNAIDLAWDVIGRFTAHNVPRSFFDGWVRVALEEAKHFSLLQERLVQLGGEYGDLDAHDGLWEAAQSTGHDLVARLAIVPLILEARGLDITPSLIRQIEDVGDYESANIFRIIYRDEEGHVAVGAKWFRFFCNQQNLPASETFQRLVRTHFRGALKPPFNDIARSRAGLTPTFYRALSSAGQ